MKLKVQSAECGYGAKTVVRGISFEVGSGDILCMLGPNGVGKTTFLKSLLGFVRLKGGEIRIDGREIGTLSQKEKTKIIGYVPQAHAPPFPYTVLEVVLMGRTSRLAPFASPSPKDVKIAEETLRALGIFFLRDRVYTKISGGERQMVLIARALAQQPQILVMDEPTSNLDFGNQVRVLERIRRLSKSGLCVVMTSHFPDHAFLCASKVALLKHNGCFRCGTPDEILTEENLRETYSVDVCVVCTNRGKAGTLKACVPVMSA